VIPAILGLARALHFAGEATKEQTLGSQLSIATAINSVVESEKASPNIRSAIQKAAHTTGVDFSYLMKKASQESSFNPTAKATTSSAMGLFQFTSQTWLHMIKDYGDHHGLGDYADQITKNANGSLSVSDPAAKQAILALRKDPHISAVMAGELDKENAAYLEQKVGGKIGDTELYLAHFLGANGAARFIREMRKNPSAAAATVLPSAAQANNSVFYTKAGEARSVSQIYQKFAQKFEGAGATRMASAVKNSTSEASLAVSTHAASNIASFIPKNTAATQTTTDIAQELRSLTKQTVASTSSSLFSAMVIGQVQDTKFDVSPLGVFTQAAENKRKNAYAAAVALG
jgi:hypothetical protein